jgi:stearoyl-CoA desaturase (delta-9 desaturase)
MWMPEKTPSTEPLAAVPAGDERARLWHWQNAFWFVAIHLVALLALVPWFFSWAGVVAFFVCHYLCGTLGITVCLHRLLSHCAFTCPLWLERALTVLATCEVQDSPAYWVAVHRRHHNFSDRERDPHSPRVSLFWSHMGWLLVRTSDMQNGRMIMRYAKDVVRDPFQAWLERNDNWFKVVLMSWAALYAVGAGGGLLAGLSLGEAVQVGLSIVVWGSALRIVYGWHAAWAVNSICHRWGYRNYDTPDDSRNNVLIGILASGEGWHNNHHADPRSARHGHKWWEFDLAWLSICLLKALGLAKDVALPSPTLAARFGAARSSG